MATITTINANDLITDSRTVINTNLGNLNSDKIETSVLDTDTALTANSDSKIATQKATKAYADSVIGAAASTTAKGVVEEATQAELTAGTQTGGTSARLFLNPVHTVATSAGASDAGKIPRLNSSGVFSTTMSGAIFKNGTTTRAGNTASGTQTIAHGVGVVPKFVKIVAYWASAVTGTANISGSTGCYNGTTNSSTWFVQESASENASSDVDNTNGVHLVDNSGSQVAVITFDATNITLTWTRTGSTGSANMNIMWEAYA